MKILFVLENYYPNIGGVETLFKQLVEQLSIEGHQITLVTTQLEKTHPRQEKIDNIEIIRYPFWNRYFFTFLAIFPILQHIRKCDLVHTTSYNAAFPAYIVAKLFRKKIVVTFHEVWGDLWFRLPFMSGIGRRLHYSFEQLLLRFKFDKFIAVSESTGRNLIANGVSKERVIVNYNGIDYQEFTVKKEGRIKSNEETFTYTFFGRLGASKGLDILLESAVLLKTKLPEAQLKMIIPKTPQHFFEEIIDLIKTKDLEQQILLVHDLSFQDLQSQLLESDCVVIPSYSEGFCYAAVETIALGVPLISSDQMALQEVVSGTFIKMENHSAEALAAAIEKAYKGKWQKTEIKRFELSETVKKYMDIYKEVIDSEQ